jgi:DNA-directed RNA polymerase subunit L
MLSYKDLNYFVNRSAKVLGISSQIEKLLLTPKRQIKVQILSGEVEIFMCAYKMLHFFAVVLAERIRKMDDEHTKLVLKIKGKKGMDELREFREKLVKEWGF